MSRNALFADIEKLKETETSEADKSVTLMGDNSTADKPSSYQPPNEPSLINYDHTLSHNPSVSRKKKKKKRKKNTESGYLSPGYGSPIPPTTSILSDENNATLSVDAAQTGVDGLRYTSFSGNQETNLVDSPVPIDEVRVDRHHTQISLLEDPVPFSHSLFDFHNKPPRLWWTYIFAFLASIDIMVNIPTLYDACNATSPNNDILYVWIFVAYILSQLVGSVVIGYWMDHRPILEILLFSGLLLAVGNLLYTHGVADAYAAYMIIGRAVCGFAAAFLVVGYAHVTRYSYGDSREGRIMYFRFITALGAIVGPLVGVLVSGNKLNLGFWEISKNNSGSFVTMCLSLAYLVALIIWFGIDYRRQQILARRHPLERRASESRDDTRNPDEVIMQTATFHWAPHQLCTPQALLLWFLYTSAVFTFWSFEAAMLPVGGNDNDPWSARELYSIFVFIGVIFVLAYSANRFLIERFRISKEKRVISSLLLMVIGSVFLTSFGANGDSGGVPKWQVVVACPFLTVGFCVVTIQTPALYCRLVGAQVGDLGVRMSWFFALASIGRLSGPVYGYLMIHHFGSVNFVSHTACLLLLVASLVAFGAIRTAEDEQDRKVSSTTANIKDEDHTTTLLSERL